MTWLRRLRKRRAVDVRIVLDAERLRVELIAARERAKQATRGHLTRTKKRVGHGVCPCCNRTFQQLGRHMKSKHPDYAEANGA